MGKVVPIPYWLVGKIMVEHQTHSRICNIIKDKGKEANIINNDAKLILL